MVSAITPNVLVHVAIPRIAMGYRAIAEWPRRTPPITRDTGARARAAIFVGAPGGAGASLVGVVHLSR